LIGCAVIAIGVFTVKVAVLEVTSLHAPVTTTLYIAASDALILLIVNIELVAPVIASCAFIPLVS
jgi:hypothetical protein